MAELELRDEVLLDDDGEEVVLHELWSDRPAAVVFMRHFGCTFCREHAAKVQERYDEIEGAGGTAVAVGMGTPAHAAEFRRMSEIEFPLLVTPDTELHERMGLAQGNWMRVLTSLPRAVREIPRYGAKITGADMSQLGGTFVVAPDDRIVYSHRARNAGDNASVDDIVVAIGTAST